jgi:hypothetical protein
MVTAEIELAPRLVARPVSFAPDLWFGVTSKLTVGVIHSNASVSRIDRAASFCFEHHRLYGCDRTYHNAGLDTRYEVRDGALRVAARARFLVRDVEPWKPAVTAGALLRWTRGRISLTSDPYLRFGLANTEHGNRTALYLPVAFGVSPHSRVELRIHTGYDSDLAVWSDGFHIPLALSARGQVTSSLELGMLGGFTSAAGPQDTLSRRTLWFWFGWRT